MRFAGPVTVRFVRRSYRWSAAIYPPLPIGAALGLAAGPDQVEVHHKSAAVLDRNRRASTRNLHFFVPALLPVRSSEACVCL